MQSLTNSVPASLQDFFSAHPRVALAFSGGTDSAYLLYAAKACGCEVRAYYVNTVFQPAFELAHAHRIVAELNAEMQVLTADILANETVRKNPKDRCYHCKNTLFCMLWQQAKADGYTVLLDGTNASDDAADRPGMKALQEMAVLSPLRLCGITKPQVRALSKEAGLFTWNKPAYACLATRLPTGCELSTESLHRVEKAEDALHAMGFSDLRVRMTPTGAAKLQLPAAQMEHAVQRSVEIVQALHPYFDEITLDLLPR